MLIIKKTQKFFSKVFIHKARNQKTNENDLREVFFRKYENLPEKTRQKLQKDLEEWDNEQ